jgi:hypothetical protein
MPDPDQLRPEQVAALTTSPPLPAELTDAILDATDAERAAAIAEVADREREWLESIGVLKPSASVLDLDYRAWAAIAAAFGTIHRTWELPGNIGKPPRDVLKIVDQRAAGWVAGVLQWGGLLPPPDPADPEE